MAFLPTEKETSDSNRPFILAQDEQVVRENGLPQILAEWNTTAADFPQHLCIHQLFEAQVEQTPNAVAVVFDNLRMTYQELNEQSNQLAHHLKALGVGPGSLVAVYMERSMEMIATLLGILKAGGAYVPLEISYPPARVQWILATLEIRMLVTRFAQLHMLPDKQQAPLLEHIVCMGAGQDLSLSPQAISTTTHRYLWTPVQLEQLPADNLPTQALAEDMAYIIFTSGSTGTPKGVVVCHKPVVNLIHWVNTTFHLQPLDRVLFVTSLCFDLSVYDIFGLLAAGGSIHIASEQDVRNPERLLSLLRHEPITFWDSAPAVLQQLVPFFPANPLQMERTSLRLVFLSGDWIPIKLPDRLKHVFPGVSVISLGGATEATVWSNYYPIGEVDAQWVSIPYGKPIQNAQYYILDAQLHPCPIGVAGDLYIGGICLSSGYIHEPILTAEKFIPNPFAQAEGSRLYKTGDQARYWSDGNIEFLGRSDQQVKIRGFRIELGEIEAVLSQHPAIQEATVLAKEDGAREKRLIAYLVPHAHHAFPLRQLLHLEAEGVLAGRHLYELPNGMVIAHQNKNETDFVYNELFADQAGLQHGIVLSEDDCIFDVGANIGLFSLLVGQLCPRSTIYAFEPLPPIFELLRINAALYGLNVKLYEYGLSKEVRSETMTYYPHVSILSGRFADSVEEQEAVKTFLLNQQQGSTGEVALSGEQLDELLMERLVSETISCRMTTLSEVIRENAIERIDLLKIDVEKSEQDVLDGIIEQDWQKIRQIMVEVYDIDNRLARITALLEYHGYHVQIEQAFALKDTRLYNIYATRSAQQPAHASPNIQANGSSKQWYNKHTFVRTIRAFLKERLPEYMLPSAFVMLEAMPITTNGKVNYKALLALPQVEDGYDNANHTRIAPRTPLEAQIAEIWATVLGRKQMSIDDNFFELGGHSLLATLAVTRIRDVAQVDLPLSILFTAPTVASLARVVEASPRSASAFEQFHIEPTARAHQSDNAPYHPLSYSQEQIWFLQQLDPTNMAYNFQATLRLTGNLNMPVLERSLSEIVRRHEIFRTTFEVVDGRPGQLIHPAQAVQVPMIDLRAIPAHLREKDAQHCIATELRKPFDLTTLPLIRWMVLQLDEQEYILIHMEHHLVHDGWSFNTFLRELTIFYQAFSSNQPSPLPDLPIQFVDFAHWQRRWVQGEAAQAQLRYWEKTLSGSPPLLALPTDRPRPKIQTFRGNAFRVEVSPALCKALRTCCQQEGYTLFMTMFAAFATLLFRYSGQEHMCLGTGIANRRSRETEGLIGMVINTLALRTDLSGNPTFRELLQRVRDVMLGAYAHQDLPFEKVVEALQPERNLSYNPLFQVMFGFHDSPLSALELPGLQVQLREGLSNGSAKFDLNVIVIPRAEQRVGTALPIEEEGITLVWEYNTDLFHEATMQRMLEQYQLLLASLSAHPELPIADVPLLTPAAWQQIVIDWNATASAYLKDQCIHQLFEKQVKQTPEAPATLFNGEQLTYLELNQRANQLAHYLRKMGVMPATLVGVYLEPSIALIVSLLAILKAGGAYVPFDLSYPKERLAFLLQDAQITTLISQQALVGNLPEPNAQRICIDTNRQIIGQESSENLHNTVTADDLAYIMYTSGSTGTPKGVAVPHRAINRLVCATNYVQLTSADRMAQISNPSFDAATFEIWGALLHGAQLIGIAKDVALSPEDFSASLQAQKISVLFLTTALFHLVASEVPSAFHALRHLLVGGETLDPRWVRAVQRSGPPQRLLNVYGPTENTTFSSWFLIQDVPEDAVSIPIGRPVAGTQLYILDRYLHPVPVGIAGELYIGGDGLARGYLNRPELTATCFIDNPFSTDPGARLYKSGDMARYLPDGSIEFLGRIDNQIKLRGFRIELGEIEVALNQHAGVQESAVMLREDNPGDKRLVAYIVSHQQPALSSHELRGFLSKKLPDYMLPATFVFLDSLPLTTNGKVDRHVLPVPLQERAQQGRRIDTPLHTATEETVARLWQQVLGVEVTGSEENFFELGGHSLLATQVIARVRAAFQIEIPLRVIFEKPTIATFAEAIEQAMTSTTSQQLPAIQPIARRQRGQ